MSSIVIETPPSPHIPNGTNGKCKPYSATILPPTPSLEDVPREDIETIIKTLEKELERRSAEKPAVEPEVSSKEIVSLEEEEEDFTQYSFFPIKYPLLEKYYQLQKGQMWTPEEINYQDDRRDWNDLDEDTRTFLKFVLFFFAQADGIVNENLIENFKHETSCYKEAQYFYASQEFTEVIHNETYSLLIEAFFRDPKEKARAFNAIKYYPSIRKIADWMFEWMDSKKPLLERVIAFACVEGIFFSSAFAAIYWIKRRNILHGFCKANEFIARDEALHTEFAVALYHTLTEVDKKFPLLSLERVHSIIQSALSVSEEFTRTALRVDLIGMNADDMIKYVKCTANTLSRSLGYDKLYDVENPFDWMAVMALPNKTNFFEDKVSEYARQQDADFVFDLDTDF